MTCPSRRIGVVSASTVAIALTLAAFPLHAKPKLPEKQVEIGKDYQRDFEYRVKRELGSGTRSRAMIVTHNHAAYQQLRVLKEVRTVHENEIAAAGGRERALELYAHRVVGAARLLRGDAGFRKRFGAIVPETVSPAIGKILQEEGEGVPISRLSPKYRRTAEDEVTAAFQMASRILSIIPSQSSKNALFNPNNGKITSWYDFVADKASRGQPPLHH